MNDTSNTVNIDEACEYLNRVAHRLYYANKISWALADSDTSRAITSLLAHFENVKAELEAVYSRDPIADAQSAAKMKREAFDQGFEHGLAKGREAGKRDTESSKEAYARGVKDGYEACVRGLDSDMIEVLTPELVEALKS